MSLVINTNSIASTAANNLHANQSNLQKSLARLSSGSKIVIPADDAGGLAVANKLKAVMNRNVRAQQNVQNGNSFLQVQDGALKTSSQILDRMSELKTMSLDVTKNSDDIANYQAEFGQLQLQLQNIRDEKFNGINLFQTSQSDLSVYTTEVGTGSATNTVAVAQVDTISGIVGDATAQVDDLAVTGGGAGDSYDITITAGGTTTTLNVASAGDADNAGTATAIQNAVNAANLGVTVDASAADGSFTVTGDAGTGAFTVDLVANDNGDGVNTAAVTDSGSSVTYAADSYSLDIGGTSVSADYRTDAAATAAALAAAINNDSTLSATVTAAVSGNDVTLTAVTAGTAFTATLSETDGNTGAGTTAAAAVINTTTDNVAGAATAQDGPNVALSRHHLFQTGTAGSGLVTAANEDLLDTANEISAFSIEELTGFIQNAATARAENGAQAQRLNWSSEMLSVNYTNVEAAHSRLWDVDFATESTAYAKQNILTQSAASMLAQANNLPSVALQLLG